MRSRSAADRSRCSGPRRSRPTPSSSSPRPARRWPATTSRSARAVASSYTGDLLPEMLYEGWAQAPRERLRSQYLELLRRSRQWELLLEVEPTDEPACRELMRRELASGSRPAAIRAYGRLRGALRRELGMLPSADTQAIYDECVTGLPIAEPDFIGRELELARATALLRSEPGAEPARWWCAVWRGSARRRSAGSWRS